MKRYTREQLLSLAEDPRCKNVPPNLDPGLLRDSPSPDIVDAGGGNKFVSRRDQEAPEWRNRNGSNGGGGLLSHQGQPRRRSQEEEGFKGPSSWSSDGNHLRGRPGAQASGQSRWEHRGGNDRERDKASRGPEQGESGSRPRFAWSGSEHDGLLGSGGGLRGPYPGGRAPERYNNGGGRGARVNDSRSNKPAGGYRNDSDDLDGETFGEKLPAKDRSEEERRRREEFESMRKEQQRMKEQNKSEKVEESNTGPDETSSGSPAPEVKPEAPLPANAPAPRPLVPPGFGQASLQKASDLKERAEELPESIEAAGRAVDPVAIACAVTDAEVFTLAESSKPILFGLPQPLKADDGTTSRFVQLMKAEEESSFTVAKKGGAKSPRSPETKGSEGAQMLPMPVAPSVEDVEKSLDKALIFGSKASSQQQAGKGKAFLTCEDIEQSLLAEAKHESPAPRFSGWMEPEADPSASRHLLSLLQKPGVGIEQSKAPEGEQKTNTPATLEALFGMSFMMELRSKEAPLSVKAVTEPRSEPEPVPRKPEKPPEGPPGLEFNHQHWASLWGETTPVRSTAMAMESGKPGEELDSGVLNDFSKFRKAMNHRNKVNDSFLGVIEGSSERSEAPPAAGLYRSHSPPLINQRSSLQFQQLKEVLVSQGSKLAAAKQQQQQQHQQFQQNVMMGNGELSGNVENRFVRARPLLSRQQQQQVVFEQAQGGGHLVAPPQGFPPAMYSSKQRPHAPAGYFAQNGAMNLGHGGGGGVASPHHMPGVGFGQQLHHHHHHHHHPHPPPPHPGLGGAYPGGAPSEVFMGGGEHQGVAAENRWMGREAAAAHLAAGVPGLYQQQPTFGMNKLGYP